LSVGFPELTRIRQTKRIFGFSQIKLEKLKKFDKRRKEGPVKGSHCYTA